MERVEKNGNHRLSLIAAIGKETRALGKDNGLIFSVKGDLRRFKELTTGHSVIMGRKTWESLPDKFRPLPNRTNIVVTRQEGYASEGAVIVPSFETALAHAKEAAGADEIFVIGGAQIYEAALPLADRLYLTIVESDAAGDVFFPEYGEFTKEIVREAHPENDPPYTYVILDR